MSEQEYLTTSFNASWSVSNQSAQHFFPPSLCLFSAVPLKKKVFAANVLTIKTGFVQHTYYKEEDAIDDFFRFCRETTK